MAIDFEKIVKDSFEQRKANRSLEDAVTEHFQQRRLAEKKKKDEEEDIAPVKRTWFNKGAFDDGYDFGDVTKSILGTIGDTGSNIMEGVATVGHNLAAFTAGGVAEAADFIGKDEYADKVRNRLAGKDEETNEFLNKYSPKEKFSDASDFFGNSSLLGEKSDNLASSAGSLLGTMALQSVGVPGMATMGLQAAGGELESAYKSGATSKEAWTSAAVTGISEAVIERLSGGISFGGKTLDELWKGPLTKSITNKTANTFAKYGLDILGEGAEEVITEAVQSLGRLSYEDKTVREALFSEEARDNYIEAFIGGGVMGGAFSAKRAYDSVKTGRDYDTGLTGAEQKVIDAETKTRTDEIRKNKAIQEAVDKEIAEIERVKGKLTDEGRKAQKELTLQSLSESDIDFSSVELDRKDISEIEKQVREDFEKGYISVETIENTLFPENSKRHKELLEESKTADEARRAEINEELKILGNTLNETLSKNELLKESYRQRELQQQPFQVEVSETDSEFKKHLVEEFTRTGAVNDRKAHETFDFLEKLSTESGAKINLVTGDWMKKNSPSSETEGFVNELEDGTREIAINIDSPTYINNVVGHEVTHLLEKSGEYTKLQNILKEYATGKGEYDQRLKATIETYKDVKGAKPENEVTAQLVGKYIFTDYEFANNLSAKDPNIFKKVYDYVKHVYKMATAGSKEARQLEQAKRIWEKAYREMNKRVTQEGKTNSTTEGDSDTKFLITKDGNGDNVVVINQNIYDGKLDTEKPHEYIADFIAAEIGNSYKIIEDGEVVYIGKDLPAEFTQSKYTQSLKAKRKDLLNAKNQSAQNLKDIVEIATDPKYEKNAKPKHNIDAKYGFYKYTTRFAVDKGKGSSPEYEAVLVVRHDADGKKYLYDITEIKKVGTLHLTSTSQGSHGHAGGQTPPQGNPTGNSIPLKGSGDNTKFSLSAPIEETKNLMAIHNLHANELLKQLDMGGLPMPSVAITKPEIIDHEGFGEVTLILNKDAIDPKTSKYNKVYGADAYTPTFPSVEYEINDEILKRAHKILEDATQDAPEDVKRKVYRFYPYNDPEGMLNSHGGETGLIEWLEGDRDMKQTYLYTKGQYVDTIVSRQETVLPDMITEKYDFLIERLGNDVVSDSIAAGLSGRQYFEKNAEAIKTAYADYLLTDGIPQETVDAVIAAMKPMDFLKEVRGAARYLKNGPVTVKEEPDYKATNEEIDRRIDPKEYKKWLQDLFHGIEGTAGLRNDVDLFDRRGNRRDFKQLHDPITLDNIVKIMRGKAQQKGEAFLGSNMFGASAQEYKSIQDVKKDSGRLGILPEEEHKANEEYVSERLEEIAQRYAGNENWWDARNALVEAVANSETRKGIEKYLHGYDYVYKLDDSIVDDLLSLRDYVRSLPTPYFEAKPQRAVGLDEVGVYVIPNNADAELKRKLLEAGYSIAEYNPDIEGDRQKVVNQFEQYKFSLSSDIAPSRGVKWSDILLMREKQAEAAAETPTEAPVDDIAPVVIPEELRYEEGRPLTEEDLPNFEQERSWSFDNITEEDLPTDTDEEFYSVPNTAPLDDKSLRLLAKNMREELNLKPKQVKTLEKIIQDFSTSEDATRETLYEMIENEFGTIYSQNKVDEVVQVKKDLRELRVKVSDTIKGDIPDYFQWKQKNFGKIRFSNQGLPVDDVYEGLKAVYPGYFPADIDNPTDQLLKMAEVANLDSVYTEEYFLPEEQIQEVTDFILESVHDYKQEMAMKASHEAGMAPIDESQIPYEPKPKRELPPSNFDSHDFTESRGVQQEYDPEADEIVDAPEPAEEDLATKTRKELRKELVGINKEGLTKALDDAKNIPMALMNNTDTIRNTELVFGRENGRIINEAIFQKEIDNEAKSIAWQNKERAEIKELGIKARSKESAAVQKYGEKQYVNEFGDLVKYGDDELAAEGFDADTQAKIRKAARVIREKYDDYIDQANGVLTQLGFEPIKKRNDYMRHFQELNDVFSRYGIPFNAQAMQEHVLPTDINGLTEFWSPQKNYFANMQPRKGQRTTLDAITGIDGYIGGIANLIYHTEDIQRGRAFEEIIRENYGQESGWDNLEKMENLSPEEYQARADKIQDNHLSNYAAWVHEWTNNIAGKKNKVDRSIESMFGRRIFSLLDQTRKQVGANMIGFNLSSSLTNLVAPVQAAAKTNKLALAKGTADTIKNIFVKDNFMEKNSFLTARMGTDMLSKTAWEKVQDAGYVFMKGMDWFSSNQIVRSKYYELRAKGMSEEQAHAEAGKFAARIMGDRTKGAQAQLYNSKLIGLVTQFQLEVNNQLYSMFYDTYHESKENAKNNAAKTAAGMTFTLGQLAAFTHVFGETFEAIAGYNPTFDIIGIIATALGGGDDEEKTTGERLKDAADKLVDALPYVNILTGGGRIPIASGIPNPIGVMTGGKDEYGNELTWGDEAKKLLYLIPPTGGNQVKKTYQGLGMFDEELPVTGSYTGSGNLRYPVEDTILNRTQAALFGQYANENARDYFDNERAPLKEKQIQEYAELDIPIAEYWEYREGLKDQETVEEKFDYIAGLDLPVSKKNIMINNIVDRDEKVDLTHYSDFSGYEEFDFAAHNKQKYDWLQANNVSYEEYSRNEVSRDAYNWAFKNQEGYAVSKAVSDVVTYRQIAGSLYDIKADKDGEGNSISGSRKEKVLNYINGLDLDYGAKLILFKSEYSSYDDGNMDIIDYLNGRDDISYEDMVTILVELGFTVDAEGNIYW